MNPNVKDNVAQAIMQCGDVAGIVLEPTLVAPEGISARQRDGKRVFLPAAFMEAQKRKRRGRG